MTSRTIEVMSNTDLVGIDIDDHGQIIWDDELTTAYEYDVAFEAMGGNSTPLTEFMAGWNTNQILTLLLHFESKSQAIHAAADAISVVVDEISLDPAWSEGFHEKEAIVYTIGLARRYITGLMTHEYYDFVWYNLTKHRGPGRKGHTIGLNTMVAAEALLCAITDDDNFISIPGKPGRLRPGHDVSIPVIKELREVFNECSSAMGFLLTGTTRISILRTDWREAKQEWEGQQVARLAELVHAARLGWGSWAELTGIKGVS